MKVADIMSTDVEYVLADSAVKDVSQIIFGRGVNGLPVCKGKKVIGFITERDILSQFFPTMQEYVQEPLSYRDFEQMEKNISEIFSMKAKDIMNKEPRVVKEDTPLLRAYSLMAVKGVGRLAVINEKGELIGMISRGDVFRVVVGDKLPFSTNEEYHDWLSRHYDLVVNWKTRLGFESPDLISLFKAEKVKNIVDVMSGTGEHDISLAKAGFNITGLENSSLMTKLAETKRRKLPINIADRIKFLCGNYTELLYSLVEKSSDAAIFMGNSLCHLESNYYEDVFKALNNALDPKYAIIALQILNFEKVLKVKNRFLDINFASSKLGLEKEHVFIEFYDPPKVKNGPLTLTMAIFDYDGKKWKTRSINSTPIANLNKDSIEKLLKDNGFKKISFYGGKFWGPLFKEPFKPLESDWLNIIARR